MMRLRGDSAICRNPGFVACAIEKQFSHLPWRLSHSAQSLHAALSQLLCLHATCNLTEFNAHPWKSFPAIVRVIGAKPVPPTVMPAVPVTVRLPA